MSTNAVIRMQRRLWSAALAGVLCCVFQAAAVPASQETGALALDGNGISMLSLQGRRTLQFTNPGAEISLPPGEYRVKAIVLTTGQTSTDVEALPKFTIESGKTTHVKAGAPLNHEVQATQFFNLLSLRYRLTGLGGETYRPIVTAKRPSFKVYQGGRLLGGDTFQFG